MLSIHHPEGQDTGRTARKLIEINQINLSTE